MKIEKTRILLFLLMLIFLLSALLVSCTDENETIEGLPEIRYERNKLTFVENEYVDLCRYMEIIDADSVIFHSSNESVIKVNGYVSSAPDVATVNEKGVIVARAVGNTVITVIARNDYGTAIREIRVKVEQWVDPFA